jgi:hypothetical protein
MIKTQITIFKFEAICDATGESRIFTASVPQWALSRFHSARFLEEDHRLWRIVSRWQG